MNSKRLDQLVAERFGLSRTKAAAVIMAGRVSLDGKVLTKAGQTIPGDAEIKYDAETPKVSRAGDKLSAALETWEIPVKGKTALDVGSSTGGFTEALLERDVDHVIAVDVGRDQLAWKLRQDNRVTSLEQTDIRRLDKLPKPVDLIVIDVSFISLTQVLPAVAKLARPGVTTIALFKPQFEVGAKTASKHKGVIKDPVAVETAFRKFKTWLKDHRWRLVDELESTVPGTKGNVERLVCLETPVN